MPKAAAQKDMFDAPKAELAPSGIVEAPQALEPRKALGSASNAQETAILAPRELRTADILSLIATKFSQMQGADALAIVEAMERMAKLQLDSQRIDAEQEFNEALSQCQAEVKLVGLDSAQDFKGKKWATYKGLDREIRPIYIKHGFSISFSSRESATPGMIVITCTVARGLHSRLYELPMDISGLGPKGEGALSKPHAILAASEYGRRCLLKLIFNIVTGDEDILTNRELLQALEKIEDAGEPEVLKHYYKEAYAAFEANPEAIRAIVAARRKREKEMR